MASVSGESFFLQGTLSDVLGITPAYVSGSILVTATGSGVHIYNTNERKCTQSWSVKPSFKFAAPAVQHPQSQQIYVVDNNGTLFTWPISCNDFDSATVKKFAKKIHSVVCVDQVVIASIDGHVACLTNDFELARDWFRPSTFGASAKVHWIGAAEHAVVLLTSEAGSWHLTLCSISPSNNVITAVASATVSAKSKSKNVLSCSIDPSHTSVALMWSNGDLQVWSLPSITESTEDNQTAQLTMKIQLQVQKDAKASIGATIIHPSYVVVASIRNGAEIVTCWDLVYGTVQFELEPSTPDLTTTFIRVSSIPTSSGHNVFMATPSGVRVLPVSFNQQGPSLLSALGRLAEATSSKPPVSSVMLGKKLRKSASLSEWTEAVEHADAQETEVLDQLCDPAQTPDQLSFSRVFFLYVLQGKTDVVEEATEEQEVEMEVATRVTSDVRRHALHQLGRKQPRSAKSVLKLKKLSQQTDEQFLRRQKQHNKKLAISLSPNFIHKVLNRCLTESAFWPEEVVEFLIVSNSVSAAAEPQLLPTIMKKHQLRLIEKSLIHIHDIPENTLVQIISYILSEAPEELLVQHVTEKSTKAQQKVLLDGDLPRDFFLYLIISASRNDVFMWPCLKVLTLTEVCALLDFLYTSLLRYRDLHDYQIRQQVSVRVPSFRQVVDWIALVMDAHFTQLILTEETHELLQSIQEVVLEHVRLCEGVESIKAHLQVFFQRNALITPTEIGEYQIEVLHF